MQEDIKEQILEGKIFIYPTDTLYGLGCDATNLSAVNKIKNIKSRDKDKPLSVIAPSLEWIENNLIINNDLNKYLPGPYTLILKKKDPNFLSHISPTDTLGIRIPANNFIKEIQKANVPFDTTSVNLAGEDFATNTKNIKQEILNQVDHVISNGELSGRPSTLIIDGKEIRR